MSEAKTPYHKGVGSASMWDKGKGVFGVYNDEPKEEKPREYYQDGVLKRKAPEPEVQEKKRCPMCGWELSIINFEEAPKLPGGHVPICRGCRELYVYEYRRRKEVKERDAARKRKRYQTDPVYREKKKAYAKQRRERLKGEMVRRKRKINNTTLKAH